jgi:hypothetical protein
MFDACSHQSCGRMLVSGAAAVMVEGAHACVQDACAKDSSADSEAQRLEKQIHPDEADAAEVRAPHEGRLQLQRRPLLWRLLLLLPLAPGVRLILLVLRKPPARRRDAGCCCVVC